MLTVSLLEFLNKVKDIRTLNYAKCESELVNFLDVIDLDEQFTQSIHLGVIYVVPKSLKQYTIVDGLGRILSLSLLLHAICECYKKTTPQNEKAIKTIRSKYLLNGTKTKLRLPADIQPVFEKIINGERLSGHEKKNPIFILLHKFWTQIKSEKLQAGNIFKMLRKIDIAIIELNNENIRNLYYSVNNNSRDLNQLAIIEDYLTSFKLLESWQEIKNIFNNTDDIILFFKDFFQSKFNYKNFEYKNLYEYFYNYYETMSKYMTGKVILDKIKHSAELYHNILNVNLPSEILRQALIQIKLHQGEDTFAYLLNVYEDFSDGSISESTFVEILNTIDEYLRNRLENPNNVTFNELIQYLNTFLACK